MTEERLDELKDLMNQPWSVEIAASDLLAWVEEARPELKDYVETLKNLAVREEALADEFTDRWWEHAIERVGRLLGEDVS